MNAPFDVGPMAHLGTDLALRLAIKAAKALERMSAEEGQRTLRSCWCTHVRDYRTMLEIVKSQPMPAAKTGTDMLSELTALALLSAYFEESGNWPKMVARLEAQIEENKK